MLYSRVLQIPSLVPFRFNYKSSLVWREKRFCSFSHFQVQYQVKKFKLEGFHEEELVFTRGDILKTIPVKMRDLQAIDDRRPGSALAIRPSCIIIKLEHLRAILLPQEVLLFDTQTEQVKNFAAELTQSIQAFESYAGDRMPFEYYVLDSMLYHVTKEFDKRLNFLLPIIAKVLGSIEERMDEVSLQRLNPVEKCLTQFDFSLTELHRGLSTLLSKTDDSGDPTNNLQHLNEIRQNMEVMMMLSEYTRKINQILGEISKVLKDIQTTRGTVKYMHIHTYHVHPMYKLRWTSLVTD
eukprot:TRINITY_DN8462_c0_g1_i1.p1 TRINITY_DN8462_c0_g1~~TRINITY_DN8462_c0_g1_i1.p1  ORF type:complete len:295 (-),score=65.54 TRINITY_DN8462_c0_g1_i1:549-1433(-)